MPDVFAFAERRLEYIDQRQQIVAQNIANADTPDYQPHDLKSFASLLTARAITPTQTDPMHLQGKITQASFTRELPNERAPDGNAVNLEGELTKVAQNETNAALVGNLWKSYMGMYMTALGHGS
jgi:flagellar basal-body rod protein FlgB